MKNAKNRLAWSFVLIMTSCFSWALEVELNISTELKSSEAEVFQAAKVISKAIVAGQNDEALAEAFLECPEDNMVEFQVNSIHLNSVWLMNAKSPEDKKYRGIINYVLTCKHNRRRGGDR